MFQKSVAIYLVLFIGVGIDPGCCLRAWISNSFASALTAPFSISKLHSGTGPSRDGSACCAETCCVQDEGRAEEHRTAHVATDESSDCSVDAFPSSCCLRHASKPPVGACQWDGEESCRCKLSKPLATFSYDGTAWTPILLSVWIEEPIALSAGTFPAPRQGIPICNTSPPERLAELCRWNC
ncbi:hypothetical protein VN12_22395 [Pirellula sp. SH-Sr6A]|nr:hypothetical protein VN12_22395 [Pirellula sp. SH-Sr6A]